MIRCLRRFCRRGNRESWPASSLSSKYSVRRVGCHVAVGEQLSRPHDVREFGSRSRRYVGQGRDESPGKPVSCERGQYGSVGVCLRDPRLVQPSPSTFSGVIGSELNHSGSEFGQGVNDPWPGRPGVKLGLHVRPVLGEYPAYSRVYVDVIFAEQWPHVGLEPVGDGDRQVHGSLGQVLGTGNVLDEMDHVRVWLVLDRRIQDHLIDVARCHGHAPSYVRAAGAATRPAVACKFLRWHTLMEFILMDVDDYLKSRSARKLYSPESDGWEWLPGDDLDRYPHLVALMSRRRIEKNVRKLSTVLLFCEGGQLKALINDKDAAMTGFCRIETLETATDDLEALLAADKLDWREQKSK